MPVPYDIELSDRLQKKIRKLQRKDPQYYEAVVNKILQITENPQLGKPLRNILKGKRRSQVGPFVLIYEIDEEEHLVIFIEFGPHDEVYKH
jgi:mRNA-degrading endonuclease RelE of RelBE toxin-antitoxin system